MVQKSLQQKRLSLLDSMTMKEKWAMRLTKFVYQEHLIVDCKK